MIYKIDFKDICDKEALYLYLKEIFNKYEFYGNNLDALMEVLMCLRECEIRLKNISLLKNFLGEYAEKVKDAFILASKENKKIKVIIY